MIIDLKDKDITLNEALFLAQDGDEIILDDKEYFEQILLDKKNITLIGRNNSIISFDAYSSKINPKTNNPYGTTGSTTFRILSDALSFKAYNITFKNSHIKKTNNGEQAVAFKSETSNTLLVNCKFISYQDTFYIDYGTNNLVYNCEIEGDVDFIFGSADCVFINTKITSKSNNKTAYFLAPSTYCQNIYGLAFKNCKFYAYNDFVTILARRWFPGGAKSPVIPRFNIIDSEFYGNIKFDFINMNNETNKLGKYSIINSKYNNDNIDDIGSFDLNYPDKILNYYKDIIEKHI